MRNLHACPQSAKERQCSLRRACHDAPSRMAMGEGRAHVLDCLPHWIWYLPPLFRPRRRRSAHPQYPCTTSRTQIARPKIRQAQLGEATTLGMLRPSRAGSTIWQTCVGIVPAGWRFSQIVLNTLRPPEGCQGGDGMGVSRCRWRWPVCSTVHTRVAGVPFTIVILYGYLGGSTTLNLNKTSYSLQLRCCRRRRLAIAAAGPRARAAARRLPPRRAPPAPRRCAPRLRATAAPPSPARVLTSLIIALACVPRRRKPAQAQVLAGTMSTDIRSAMQPAGLPVDTPRDALVVISGIVSKPELNGKLARLAQPPPKSAAAMEASGRVGAVVLNGESAGKAMSLNRTNFSTDLRSGDESTNDILLGPARTGDFALPPLQFTARAHNVVGVRRDGARRWGWGLQRRL
eukprot:SAG22_NODE_25_length_30107_cov_28.456412_9_plen_402_part_00